MREVKTYILAYLDVLGFTKLVEDKGLEEVYEMYENLIDKVDHVAEHYRLGGFHVPVPVSKREMGYAYAWGFNLEYSYASDTILIWCEFNRFNIVPFLECINTLFCSALEIEMPLRGTITFGDAILSKSENIYIGKPIIEGAICEKNQAWMGISFGYSLISNIEFGWIGNLKNVIPFRDHIKTKEYKGNKQNSSSQYMITSLVLDWPRFIRTNGKSEEITHWLDSKANCQSLPSSVKDYYALTKKFVEYSQEYSDWHNGFSFQKSRIGGYFEDEAKKTVFVYSFAEEWFNNRAQVRPIAVLDVNKEGNNK